MMNHSRNYQIKLIGYCELAADTVLTVFQEKGVSSLTQLKGEYVIVIENYSDCHIITSLYGVCQYYYTVQNHQFFHDDTVMGVLQKSQIPWEWNWPSLADWTVLDHLLGNDTLHPQIHRVPPGSIVHFQDGNLQISSLTWDALNPDAVVTPQTALDAFNQSIREWITDQAVVSMSGGFDSRAILSSFLKQDCRPFLVTMGSEDATDVIISRKIASSLGLDIAAIPLKIADYLTHGSKIVALTNGTKSARHWHTYLYTHQANLGSNRPFFVGTNGEFARTFYFDKGMEAFVKNMMSPLESLQEIWQPKLKSIFNPEELNSFPSAFAEELTPQGQLQRLQRIINFCHHQLLSGLDRFYLEQRVRNFMGNGLKLYSENVDWRAPFLSQAWIREVWNLNRWMKLGSNWHRFAIQKNYPQLLDFPEEGKADKMYPNAPLFYWHPNRYQYPTVSYANYSTWFQSQLMVEFILDNRALLSDLIDDENIIIAIVEEHLKNQKRTLAMAFFITMIFWKMNLKCLKN